MIHFKNIDIRKSELENIINIIFQNKNIDEIILFGSRAKGNFENGSDIDLTLKGNHLSLNSILDISIQLDELELPYKFDFVI